MERIAVSGQLGEELDVTRSDRARTPGDVPYLRHESEGSRIRASVDAGARRRTYHPASGIDRHDLHLLRDAANPDGGVEPVPGSRADPREPLRSRPGEDAPGGDLGRAVPDCMDSGRAVGVCPSGRSWPRIGLPGPRRAIRAVG